MRLLYFIAFLESFSVGLISSGEGVKKVIEDMVGLRPNEKIAKITSTDNELQTGNTGKARAKDEGVDVKALVDRTLKDSMKFKSFNPFRIPKAKINFGGLKKVIFTKGHAWNLQNFGTTGNCTMRKTGNDSIVQLNVGGNGLYVTGVISGNGPLDPDFIGKVSIRADVQFVDLLVTVSMPTTPGSQPKLLDIEDVKLKGLRVKTTGSHIANDLLNTLTTFFYGLCPAVLLKVLQKVLPDLAENLVKNTV